MPPKAKSAATKGAAASTKPTVAAVAAAAEDTMMAPPTTKNLVPYFINVRDAAVVTYYNDAAVDYVEVKVHVNSVVPKGSCKFTVAADWMSISWQRVTDKVCFTSKHLKVIMKDNYSTGHNQVIAYNNVAQKMMDNKVAPAAAGRFWGGPQVIRLKAHVTGWVPPRNCFCPIQSCTQPNGGENPTANSTSSATARCSLKSSTSPTW